MKLLTTLHKEYLLALLILVAFITYFFDLLQDGMVMSGVFAVISMLYIAVIWQERVHDERDDYIRSRVDRLLYLLTLVLIFIDILYKTVTHQSYMGGVIILTVLSLAKVILSKLFHSKG